MKPLLNQRIAYFFGSMLITLLLLRIPLYIYPHLNLNVGSFNIHHLFPGTFLLIIVILFFLFDYCNKYIIVLAGISSALILDEIIYLIFTDGSDLSYLTLVSLFGMIILVCIIALIAGGLYYGKNNRKR